MDSETPLQATRKLEASIQDFSPTCEISRTCYSKPAMVKELVLVAFLGLVCFTGWHTGTSSLYSSDSTFQNVNEIIKAAVTPLTTVPFHSHCQWFKSWFRLPKSILSKVHTLLNLRRKESGESCLCFCLNILHTLSPTVMLLPTF